MSADRVKALAADLSAALNVTVYAEPGAPGRGGLFAFLEPPTLLLDPAARTFCVKGREPRLSTSLVVVGTGIAAGQLLALLDAATDAVQACDALSGWSPSADALPATYGELPAYTIPLTSR